MAPFLLTLCVLRGAPRELLEDGVAHVRWSRSSSSGLHDIASAQAGIEHLLHRIVDEIGLLQ